MNKRLVFCCDGTWNSHDDPSPTNVFKLREIIEPKAGGVTQSVYYDTGVGTRGGWLRRAFAGATGHGLSKNVRQAYTALVDNYDPGDELFFFGFSRGAFTVRSLAGLIRNCGILRRDRRSKVEEAYQLYRKRGENTSPGSERATRFRAENSLEDRTHIKCIGVWDTVGSLGNPLMGHGLINRGLRFHDVNLSSTVEFAYQALAIDEHRKHFSPALWGKQEHATEQTLEQVWFIGAHADVGGGYPRTGLSNIALDWLVRKAAGCGLGVNEERLEDLLGKKFPHWLPVAHDSQKGFYKLFSSMERDIGSIRTPRKLPTNEKLHWSVIARWKQDLGYRPPSLVRYVEKNPGVLEDEPDRNPALALDSITA